MLTCITENVSKYIAGNNPDITEQQQDCVTAVGRFVEAECMAVDDTSNDCASSHPGICVIWGNVACWKSHGRVRCFSDFCIKCMNDS